MKLSPILRKAIGLSVVVLFGLLQLLFIGTLVYSVINGTSGAEQAMSFIFVIALFAFPVWWGFRMWKSVVINKVKTAQIDSSINSSLSITIHTTLGLAEYRKLMFLLSYSSPLFIYVHLIGITMLTVLLFKGEWNWFTLFILFFLLYLPIGVFRSARKLFDSSKMLHEQLSYTFTAESIVAAGQTFNTTIKWESLFKTKETRQWFLLYTNAQAAMVVPKSAFASAEEIGSFRLMAGIFTDQTINTKSMISIATL